ncbi:MAG TPA: hypothetical protein VGI12_09315 [Vicinamibacterales bacterium]
MRSAVLLASLLLAVPAPVQKGQTPAPPPKKNPLLKLVQPWPSPEKMKEQRATSEGLPLFAQDDILPITLVGDFKTINKDHNPDSKQKYPGTLRLSDNTEIAVTFGARGHVRRMARTCDYVPLRVEFEKSAGKGSVFAHQEGLKLVVQCAGGGDFEQFLLREYLAYRIYNVVTKQSFRARLARVSYVDPVGKPIGTRLGMFLEDDTDVARRLEGRTVKLPRLMFDDVDSDSLMPAMILEFMIGNTDMSLYALHNVCIVQRPDRTLLLVPYDFDLSGLVNPPYAIPARGLLIKSVTERLYRGPCRNQERVDPYIANFVAKKDEIRALPDQIPGMTKQTRQTVRDFIDGFYSAVRTSKDVKGLFVSCSPKPTM